LNTSSNDENYLAALIDGEGYVGLTKHYQLDAFIPKVVVEMTNSNPVNFLKDFVGVGKVTRRIIKSGKVAYTYRVPHDAIVSFLDRISPFMKVKKQQAEELSNFLKQREQFPLKGGLRSSDEWKKICEQKYELIKRLNN
jgi:hypothetical protein